MHEQGWLRNIHTPDWPHSELLHEDVAKAPGMQLLHLQNSFAEQSEWCWFRSGYHKVEAGLGPVYVPSWVKAVSRKLEQVMFDICLLFITYDESRKHVLSVIQYVNDQVHYGVYANTDSTVHA